MSLFLYSNFFLPQFSILFVFNIDLLAVSCGRYHLAVLTSDGDVATMGFGEVLNHIIKSYYQIINKVQTWLLIFVIENDLYSIFF